MDFIVEQEHLEYLDGFRESGETNMFGSVPYIMEEFEITKQNATHVLKEWMSTFSERNQK
jgi:hypothetical protein